MWGFLTGTDASCQSWAAAGNPTLTVFLHLSQQSVSSVAPTRFSHELCLENCEQPFINVLTTRIQFWGTSVSERIVSLCLERVWVERRRDQSCRLRSALRTSWLEKYLHRNASSKGSIEAIKTQSVQIWWDLKKLACLRWPLRLMRRRCQPCLRRRATASAAASTAPTAARAARQRYTSHTQCPLWKFGSLILSEVSTLESSPRSLNFILLVVVGCFEIE